MARFDFKVDRSSAIQVHLEKEMLKRILQIATVKGVSVRAVTEKFVEVGLEEYEKGEQDGGN